MKAIVIGAGIGGLTAAIALEQRAIEVEIYERTAEVQAVGAGITLWANAIAVFKALGMRDALLNLGTYEGQGSVRSSTGAILTAAKMNDPNQHSVIDATIVHRAELHKLLCAQIHTPIQLGSDFTHYEETPDGIIAHFANGTTAQGDVLIAADGIHSTVRKQISPQVRPVYSGYTAYRAVLPFDHARVAHGWGESWGRGSRFGLAPLSQGRVYWFGTENTPKDQHLPTPEATKAHLQTLFARWHTPIPRSSTKRPPQTFCTMISTTLSPSRSGTRAAW